MKPKIYKIINDLNDKVYVGQTYKTIDQRFERHCGEARWRNTKKMPIVMAIRKYGREHFKIVLLEELNENSTQFDVDTKEIEWGLKLDTLSPNGYNLKLGNGNKSISEETRIKIGNSHRGRKASPETIQRLSDSHKGFVPTETTREKLSVHFKGKPVSENTKRESRLKNSKKYILKSPDGIEVEVVDMKKFCIEHDFWPSNMCNVVKGKKQSYKGWTLVKDCGYMREELGSRRCKK